MSKVEITPDEIDIVIAYETDNTFEVQLTDEDGKVVDITNDKVRIDVKDKIGGTSKITKTNGVGEHEKPKLGRTRFTFSQSDTSQADLSATGRTTWVYDVRREDSNGNESVHLHGKFIVVPYISDAIA